MDISTEIAAVQAASQGSQLREPLVGALNKLNSGTLPSVTSQDIGKILKVGENGWELGNKSDYMPIPTATKEIIENGNYDVTNYSNVFVHISGGGSSVLVSKTITENGIYNPIDDNADGYSEVIVNVYKKNVLMEIDSSTIYAYSSGSGKGGFYINNLICYYSTQLNSVQSITTFTDDGITRYALYRNGYGTYGFFIGCTILKNTYKKLCLKIKITQYGTGWRQCWIAFSSQIGFNNSSNEPINIIKKIFLASQDRTSAQINAQTGVVINSVNNYTLNYQQVEIDISDITQDVCIGFFNCDLDFYITDMWLE